MTTFNPPETQLRRARENTVRDRLHRLEQAREAEHGERAFSDIGISVDMCILTDLLDAYDTKVLDRIADERSKIAELKLEMNQLRTNLHLARDAMKLFGIAECEACQGRGVLQVGQTRGVALCPPVNGCGGTGWRLTPPEDTEPKQLPDFWPRVLGRTHPASETTAQKGKEFHAAAEKFVRESIVGDGSEAQRMGFVPDPELWQRLRLAPIFALIDAHPIHGRRFETDSDKLLALSVLLSPGPYGGSLRVDDISALQLDRDVIPDTLWDEALRLAEAYELERGES